MIRILVAMVLPVALAACQCGFDASKLDDIACSGDGDCPPGQYCFEGNCSRLDCVDASDCGDAWAFECVAGRCAPVPCEIDADCPDRRRCVDGLCGGGGAPCTLHEECEDGVWCNGDERCDDGACAAGLPPDCGLELAPCEVAVCLEESRTCRAEPADDGSPCEDGDPCTGPDTCTSQVCTGGGDACADDLACTPGDCIPGVGCVVDPGACAIDGACWSDGDEQPGNPCMICDPRVDPLAWSPGLAVPCDDGDDCTADDSCAAGVCGGRAYDCPDEGLACTEDLCDGLGGCLHRPAAGSCLIDGACFAPGESNPLEPCEACDPGIAPTAWTPDDSGVPLDDGIACTRGACVGGQGVHTADDALCAGAGEVCAVCAGGCAVPPNLTIDCGVDATQPGAAHACTITGAAAACLACTSRIGMTSMVRNDFEPCQRMSELGWELDGQEPQCDGFDGGIGLDPSGRTTLERTIDTRGFDSVRLCYELLDVGMGGNDEIEISIDTGLFWSQASLHTGGPFSQADWVSTVLCTDLVEADPAAADNPSLGIRFDANLSATIVAIDDLAIDAWDSAYVDHPGRIVDDHFADCDLGGWTEAGDGIVCPTDIGFNFDVDALEANDAAVAIFQVIDLSDRCDDLQIGFSTAAHEGFWPRDYTSLHVDRGAGNTLMWEAEAGSRNNDTFLDPEVVLSHVDPDLRFQPAVTFRFDMNAGANGVSQWLDDVWIDGATCRSGDALLTIGAPIDAGAGVASVTVTSPVQTTAYLECTWAGVDATAMPEPVVFRY